MKRTFQVMAICGSIREQSSNLRLLQGLQQAYIQAMSIDIYTGLGTLPPFNPDEDGTYPPQSVTTFRQMISAADGILICTPEYAMGVPGVLKNALDWTVSSMNFSKKPVALITASTSGEKAHRSLLDTLLVIESDIPEDCRMLISFIGAKMNGLELKDAPSKRNLDKLMQHFTQRMNRLA